MDTIERNTAAQPSRRSFLVGAATAGAGLAFGYSLLPRVVGSAGEAFAAGNYSPTMWYAIAPSGIVTVHTTKAEGGQHIGTAQAQAVAEELEVDWRDVRLDYLDSAPALLPMMATVGSFDVMFTHLDMRKAGAAGRIALIEAGAQELGATPADCHAAGGWVIAKNGKRMSYGQLVSGGKVSKVFTPDELKKIDIKTSDMKLVGKSVPALDIPAKTNGGAKFGMDMFAPGMLYAKIVRPPVRYGATPKAVDDAAAKNIPGYRQFVSLDDPSKVAVHYVIALADNFPAAMKAAKAIKVDWDLGPNKDVSSASVLARARELTADTSKGIPAWAIGDAAKAMGEADGKIEAEYVTPHVSHGQIEPMSCLAEEKDGVVHIHSGCQYQIWDVPITATALGLKPEQVIIHQAYLGGSYGRRLEPDAMIPAALAARAVGRPVKLIFDRTEEMQNELIRPISYHKMAAGFGKDGALIAVTHEHCAAWGKLREGGGTNADLFPTQDKKQFYDITQTTGSDAWYSIPNYLVRSYLNDVDQAASPPGYLRSIGGAINIFPRESFIDEIAAKLGKDPVAFRLSMLKADGMNAGGPPFAIGGAARLIPVIHKVVELSGWEKKRGKLGKGRGIGIAVAEHIRFGPTWTACVAEVAVDLKTGEIKVEKLTMVADLGTVVNPKGAEALLEGGGLMGTSIALYEETVMANGGYASTNFDTYPIMRQAQMPEVEAVVMSSGHPPTGIGEPGITTPAAAIGNAVFEATGVRLRELPMTPDKLLAAMKKA
jgi:isoquinoline 1-oxidoreductase subunit beta